ncbi:MAG: ribonuclease R [Candidatus Vogelbacteria bacterium]|nr:ribonuclease R [Candidatus Vogelbacteria bacterium]
MLKHKNQNLVGRLSLASKRGGYFLREDSVKREDELFIESDDLATALNGDKVEVNGKKVVRILERAKKQFTGTVKSDHNYMWLKPYDTKVYSDILIEETPETRVEDGDRVIVEITNWKDLAGKVVQNLGRAGDNNTEMHTIMFEHKIQYNFPTGVEHEAKEISKQEISEKEISNRKDFRDILTFTIDPADAKDFDDAISFKELGDGRFEIGIHIADVSYFVQPGSALDQEAAERATSVYLVDRTIPMLPEVLSNGVCSLVPNEDRLTFSAVFILDKNAKVLDKWFGKTIIHSNKRFTYEDVDKILDLGKGEFSQELLEINKLAKKLRDERFAKGSMDFESNDVKFKLDATGKPIAIIKMTATDSHKLIEEFMLLANKKVAEFVFYKAGHGQKPGSNTFIYRIHDLPNQEKIAELKKFLRTFNYKFDKKDNLLSSKKLNNLIMQADAKPEERLVQSTILRSMAKAIYTTRNIGHFSLAFPCYTHFTSPIRRYPDIMVHRLLNNYLEGGKSPDKNPYERLCMHSSQMERKAMEAEWASIKYKQIEYNMDKIGTVYTGVITSVTEWGFFVEAKETISEGMVSLRNMKDDYYVFDKKNFALVGKRTKKRYRLGDEVKIKLHEVNLERRTIDFVIV